VQDDATAKDGTQDELIRQGGAYAELYNLHAPDYN
jgi:ABC-type multidrug transport system fused ATPase/permease subunit